MAHYSIIIPDDLASQLNQEAADLEVKKSTYITQLLRTHYEKPASALEAQIEEQQFLIDSLQSDCNQMQERLQRMQDTAEQVRKYKEELKTAQEVFINSQTRNKSLTDKQETLVATIAELQDKLEKANSRIQTLEKQLTDNKATIKDIEQRGKDAIVKAREVGDTAAKEAASHQVVVHGLQNEISMMKQQLANSESTLHLEREHLSELRQDKQSLQKQLELVTLRLPAPKVGFWSRILGPKKEKEVKKEDESN